MCNKILTNSNLFYYYPQKMSLPAPFVKKTYWGKFKADINLDSRVPIFSPNFWTHLKTVLFSFIPLKKYLTFNQWTTDMNLQ